MTAPEQPRTQRTSPAAAPQLLDDDHRAYNEADGTITAVGHGDNTAGPGLWNQAIGPGGTRKAVPESEARRVWIAAGGRCTFCGKNLLVDETTGQEVLIGQLAHIVGATTGDGSPRGQDPLPVDQRNLAANLMLLCYDQHHVIDSRSLWEVYDTEALRRIKRSHEARIRALTAMVEMRNSVTVLRLVGAVGDVPVDLSDRTVIETLLERDAFPDFKLRALGDEFEIDLRQAPGGTPPNSLYWHHGAAAIIEKGEEIKRAVARGLVTRVAVLALARIPLLIELGNVLGEALPIDLYPARKTGAGGFGWTDEAAPAEFTCELRTVGTDPTKVAVLVSVTGTVDTSRLPSDIDDEWTLYDITVAGGRVGPGLDRSQHTIDNFRSTWAGFLAQTEKREALQSIAVFPAVPATLAITIGRCLIRGRSPSLAVYDLSQTGAYELALEVTR